MTQFIILDRDGVINHGTDHYIKTPEEFIAIPGSLEAIAALNKQGYRVLIATNQSGVARGLYSLEDLDRIHEKLMQELAAVGGYIEEIFCCPHHPNDHCLCRKPKPGLLKQIQKKYPLNLAETYFIGDSHVDVEAALAFGCQPLLVLTGKGQKAKTMHRHLATIPTFNNLSHAVDFILR